MRSTLNGITLIEARGRVKNKLVVVEDLERVLKDRLDNTRLPARVGDVASRVGAQQSQPTRLCLELA